MRGGTDLAYRDLFVDRFQLEARKKVRALSKGNRQKVQLVAAFATRADLLILDEPTSGLDPLMEVAFRRPVLEAKERGQTVFLSSHILSEVEALCDRVGILREGRLVDEGTLAEFRHLHAQTVEVTFAGPPPTLDPCPASRSRVPANTLRFEVTGPAGAARGARRPSGDAAHQPRAVARGDLPAPLRRLDGRCRQLSARCPSRRSPTRVFARSGSPDLVRVPGASPNRRRLPPPATRRSQTGIAFARSFGGNKAVELFYGAPHDLLTVGGYAAWRVGGAVAIFAGVFGLLAAVRALRAEEDAGRQELVLAGTVSRRLRASSARSPRSAPGAPSSGSDCSSGWRRPGWPSAARRSSRSRRSRPWSSSPASARSRRSSRRLDGSRSSLRPAPSWSRLCCA